MGCKNKKTGKKKVEAREVTTSTLQLAKKMASSMVLFDKMSTGVVPPEHMAKVAVQAGFSAALIALNFDIKDVHKITKGAEILTGMDDEDECQCGKCRG